MYDRGVSCIARPPFLRFSEMESYRNNQEVQERYPRRHTGTLQERHVEVGARTGQDGVGELSRDRRRLRESARPISRWREKGLRTGPWDGHA